MREAADEEIDHLNWCHQRIDELDDHLSYLNPLWYAGSLAIGIGAGLAGDKWSLGFVAETEKQVVAHLQSHLEKLPKEDNKSRAIIEQMIVDESKHAEMAMEEGGEELPEFFKSTMRSVAKLMTTVAAKI
jgi:ubiquinone biosynthesis monooxygenase Coq7